MDFLALKRHLPKYRCFFGKLSIIIFHVLSELCTFPLKKKFFFILPVLNLADFMYISSKEKIFLYLAGVESRRFYVHLQEQISPTISSKEKIFLYLAGVESRRFYVHLQEQISPTICRGSAEIF